MKHVVYILTILTCGCSTVSVHRDTAKVGGVPFYTLKSQITQQSVYHRPFIEVTLRTTAFDATKDPTDPKKRVQVGSVKASGVLRVLDSAACQNFIDYLQKFVGQQSTPFETITEAMRNPAIDHDCAAFHNVADLNSNTGVFLVSNKVTEKLVPDTDNMYFINGRTYLLGKGKADFELDKNMTLTKVASEVETDIAQTVLDLLPINSYLTEKFVTPLSKQAATSDAAVDNVQKVMSLSNAVNPEVPDITQFIESQLKAQKQKLVFEHVLTVSSQTVVFTYSRELAAKATPTAIGFADPNSALEITWIKPTAGEKKEPPKEEEKGKAITISGKIGLPEAPKPEDKPAPKAP